MKTALQFSGGKDSLACLHLMKPLWDDLTVVWCNTGAALPETVEMMTGVRQMVPHFAEIKSNQPAQRAEFGLPTDVLPVRHTAFVQFIAQQQTTPRMQSFIECCMTNIMKPLYDWCAAEGVQQIIRGQKLSDNHRSPVRHGDVVDGVKYVFPVEDWTDEEVLTYLKMEGVDLPRNYAYFNSSVDCWNCTAFVGENAGKLRYLRDFHSDRYASVFADIAEIHKAVSAGLADLDAFVSPGATEKVH